MNEPARNEPRVRITGRLVFGLVVITVGVLFTMDNLGLVDASQILRWWPLVLVAYGVTRLTGFASRQSYAAGAIFTGIGGWLILKELGVIQHDPWDLWPLILVFLGATLVTRSFGRARTKSSDTDPSSRLSTFAMWAGIERKVVSPDFTGGDVTAIMGGHEIDLRSATIAGESAIIDLVVLMGGVDLRIPENWRVSCEAVLLMGGFEDHTRAPAGEIRGHLVLRGLVMMGGIEVKN